MAKASQILCIGASFLLLAGCATPPVPFQLFDSASKVEPGVIFPDSERIEVTVDGALFKGFYIVESGAAISQTLGGRRFIPRDTVTTFSSNSARAHLMAETGQQLNCDFLIEGRRAIGECRTPGGAIYELTAEGK